MDYVTGYGAREKRWRKLSFEIEVAEIGGNDMSRGRFGAGYEKVGPKEDVEDGVGGDGGVDEVSVTLDPEEHQAYAWVTEKEIKEGKYAMVTAEQNDLMLEAFRLRKAHENNISAMLDAATRAVSMKKGSWKECLDRKE